MNNRCRKKMKTCTNLTMRTWKFKVIKTLSLIKTTISLCKETIQQKRISGKKKKIKASKRKDNLSSLKRNQYKNRSWETLVFRV